MSSINALMASLLTRHGGADVQHVQHVVRRNFCQGDAGIMRTMRGQWALM